MTEALDEWMTVPDAAKLKDVAESSVRKAIETGRLTGKKIGRNYLVSRKDVMAGMWAGRDRSDGTLLMTPDTRAAPVVWGLSSPN